jgi:diguanylate cyclase (GGDEF)-like protein
MSEAVGNESPVALVVDDEEIMQSVLRDILQESGYRVDVAENGETGLAKVKANTYDLVFADIRMPRMDGMELLKRVTDLKPTLSVIMMTGFASVDVAVEAMKLGAFDFITKPFNLEHIKIVASRAIEKKKLEKQAEEGEYYKKLSLTDGLTELFNHRYFHQLLNVEWSRSKRNDARFCLFMLDVDDFKNYNDTLGHTAGDYVLRFLAWLLKYHARVSDMVCRYGGEEFAIILPETDVKHSKVAAERFRRLVEEAEFEKQQVMPGGNLTVSIGISCYPEDGATPEELLERADKALYQAKHEGKNRVVAWADLAGDEKEGDA